MSDKKLSPADHLAALRGLRASARGDACVILADTITKLDTTFGQVFEMGDVPGDIVALRNTLVAVLQNFNSIADRVTAVPDDPNVPRMTPLPPLPPMAVAGA